MAAAARHIQLPDVTLDDQRLQLYFLKALFDASKTEYIALPRALFKSTEIWVAAVKVLRRAALENTEEAQGFYRTALETFSSALFPVSRESPEYADAMVAGWGESGLFPALNETVPFLVKVYGASSAYDSITLHFFDI